MPANAKRYNILGVEVDSLTMAQATERIDDRIDRKGASYVTKPYVEFFDAASRDDEIRRLLSRSYLCLPDGVSTQWAAEYLYGGRRWWGRALWLAVSIMLRPSAIKNLLPDRFAGANFTWEVLKNCAANQRTVYLIGSPKSGSIATTTAAIVQRLPNIKVVGTRPGELGGRRGQALRQALNQEPSIIDELVEELKAKKPDVILIGIGFPLQEMLMSRLAGRLDHGIMIGEGGTFDYDSFGGIRKRAPQWLQRIGLEWLWRLMLEPTRVERQKAIPRFMWRVYRFGATLPHRD